MATRIFSFALAACVVCSAALPAGAADWPMFGHDPARTSVDAAGPILTASNVGRLRQRWRVSFGAVADSTPILLEHVTIGGVSRSMVFQTATNGVTFGIDAKMGKILWRFVTHGPNITASTPAADPSGRAIYVPGVDGFVHKVDAATGHELRAPGFPARITRMPGTEKDASPLNVANGFLYATTSGYDGDSPPYDGHVVSVRLSNGATHVFNSLCSQNRALPTPNSCSDSDSGIWGRGGAVADPDAAMHGQVYATTGNGDFDANAGGHNYGDSVLALSADVSRLIGSYTPANYDYLQNYDVDMGSTSPAVLPRQPASHTPLMVAQGGKDQVLRLVSRAPLPGIAHEIQELNLPGPMYSSAAVWTDTANRTWLFLGFSQAIVAYRLVTSMNGVSRLVGMWQSTVGQTGGEGTSPVVSNGIVFVAMDGAIFALDAHTGHALWSSAMGSARGTIGSVHWQSPIVVNGWVYCSDENANLTAYALP
jgi:outer membrane protein assembly factor BamB